jgi:hypothetical protein
MHYFADGYHAWVAVKFAYIPGAASVEYAGNPSVPPNLNYYVSRNLLVAIASVSTDVVMAEAESFVFANMVSSEQHAIVKNNILSDCAWFSNTHGANTLEAWMSPMAPGFNIPDAQQNTSAGCQGMYALSACGQGGSQYVFDSCDNEVGSKLHSAFLFRMRCPSLSANCSQNLISTHSIWFRIPMTYRSICDDSTGQLMSTSPVSSPMLSFSTVTLSGNSFSTDARYSCVFSRPFPQPNIVLIRARYINSASLICHIVDDFVASDQDMPIGLEQEICAGGTCAKCPLLTSEASLQRHSSFFLMFAFLPSLLKSSSAIHAVSGSRVSVSVAGGYFNLTTNVPVFPSTRVLLEDAKGVSVNLSSVYVPGTWPMGVLEFIIPDWPNDSDVVRLSAVTNHSHALRTIYCKDVINVTLAASWKSAFPLEISDRSRQINVTGSGFVKIRLYACVFSPLSDDADEFAPSISVDAIFASINLLTCTFSATAGRYRLNVYENGVTLFKSGAYTDVIFIERVFSVAPTQVDASGAGFLLTVMGVGFDPDNQNNVYSCVIASREKIMMASSSAVVFADFMQVSSASSLNQARVVCTFSPWIYTSGTFELRLINQRFNRVLSDSILKVVILPVWTSIFPSTGTNLLSSIVTISGYGLPSSLYIEATFRSVHDGTQSAKTVAALPQSPSRVVFETPIWPFPSFSTAVELSFASTSILLLFSGASRAFAFDPVPSTLKFTPLFLDCSSPMDVVVYDALPFLTNGSGYQCQLASNVSEVTVPAVYIDQTKIRCRFGSWQFPSIPSTLQLLYFGSKVAISRSAPLCEHQLSSVSPSIILSGSRSHVTIFGSFFNINLKYSCVVNGLKSAPVFPNPTTMSIVCVIIAPLVSSVLNTFLSLSANDFESDAFPFVIQPSWKSLFPSVVCLNTETLLTVTGALFSKNNSHELVFEYQTVDLEEYLKGTYVRPFPLPKLSVVSSGIEVIKSSVVIFKVPSFELVNAIEIQVYMRINGNLIPVDSSPNLSQLSLPFFVSTAEFSPDQLEGIVSYYDSRDLKVCQSPCLWNPRAGNTGALVGSALLDNGWVMSPNFVSQYVTNISANMSSTLIIGFTPPNNSMSQSQQFLVSHGSLPYRARLSLWSSADLSASLRWTDSPDVGRGLSSPILGGPGPLYWVGSYHQHTVRHSLDTADHLNSTAYQVYLNSENSPLFVGSCLDGYTEPSSCKFNGGIKFIILFDRELSSQEHLNIARWANLVHDMPSFRRSDSSFVWPWGVFPGSKKPSFTSCAAPVTEVMNVIPACEKFADDDFEPGFWCISANFEVFRLSLSGGYYARSPSFQAENWLSDPASSFVCEISNMSGYKLSVKGKMVSATYPSNTSYSMNKYVGSNFADNVVIECGFASILAPSSFVNGIFRY